MIAPITDLVGETGETKVTRSVGNKKKNWYWAHVHKEVFDLVKHPLVEEDTLAYSTYG